MDLPDHYFISNRDWDPSYLSMLFRDDFYDMSDLWNVPNSLGDNELLEQVNILEGHTDTRARERYIPIVEDITVEDDVLLDAVNQIESR